MGRLSAPALRALLADPHGPVPAEHLSEVIASGQLVYGVYWSESAPGPDGMYLPARIAVWLDRRAKLRAWTDADEAYHQAVVLPSADFELDVGQLMHAKDALDRAHAAYLESWA